MEQQTIPESAEVKRWALSLDIVEEGDATKAHAVLHAGAKTLESNALARRNPHDESVPEIGDEYAAGRALVDLGEQLIRAGSVDAASHEDGRFG
jgi:hypothetical protein